MEIFEERDRIGLRWPYVLHEIFLRDSLLCVKQFQYAQGNPSLFEQGFFLDGWILDLKFVNTRVCVILHYIKKRLQINYGALLCAEFAYFLGWCVFFGAAGIEWQDYEGLFYRSIFGSTIYNILRNKKIW